MLFHHPCMVISLSIEPHKASARMIPALLRFAEARSSSLELWACVIGTVRPTAEWYSHICTNREAFVIACRCRAAKTLTICLCKQLQYSVQFGTLSRWLCHRSTCGFTKGLEEASGSNGWPSSADQRRILKNFSFWTEVVTYAVALLFPFFFFFCSKRLHISENTSYQASSVRLFLKKQLQNVFCWWLLPLSSEKGKICC